MFLNAKDAVSFGHSLELSGSLRLIQEDAEGEAVEVGELLRQLEMLAGRFAEAGAGLDEETAARLRTAVAKVNRAVPKTSRRGPAASPAVTARQQVIEALNELGVPATPQLVAGFHQARFGSDLNPRVMASLRRDELRAWRAGSSQRSVLVVPALTPRLAPARGLFTLSTWPTWLRVVGPQSIRVDNLRVVRLILDLITKLGESSPSVLQEQHERRRERLEALLWRYGSSLPGVDRAGLDLAVARATAEEELQEIEEQDRTEREAAAERLRELGEEHQLFGALLGVAEGR